MEEGGDRARLVAELARVQGLVRQLEHHLQAAPADAAAADLCRSLARQILALTDSSIAAARACPALLCSSPLSSDDGASDRQQRPFGTPTATASASSPRKRKATARWSSSRRQVRVAAGAGAAEGPADDGHSWRKYGQKDILGARHPRAYYRCTHRNSQRCPATKQVQRTDADPALFDVVYHGEHTCRPSAAAPRAQQQHHNPHAHAALQGLAARLTVATAAAADAAAAALPPLTPESSCPTARGGAASPWSLASPVASDSNGGGGAGGGCLHPCGPAPGYADWPAAAADGGDLQEVVSAFAAVHSSGVHPPAHLDDELMPMPEYYGFDDHCFNIDELPSLFFP